MQSSRLAQAAQLWARVADLEESHPAIEALAAVSAFHAYSGGDVIARGEDCLQRFFLVTSGFARVVHLSSKGHEIWRGDFHAGAIVGGSASSACVRADAMITAKVQSEILSVGRNMLLETAGMHADLALFLARIMSERLDKVSARLDELLALPVKTRLHDELSALATPTCRSEAFEIRPAPRITALSERVYASRAATARALRELELMGVLERQPAFWAIRLNAARQISSR